MMFGILDEVKTLIEPYRDEIVELKDTLKDTNDLLHKLVVQLSEFNRNMQLTAAAGK